MVWQDDSKEPKFVTYVEKIITQANRLLVKLLPAERYKEVETSMSAPKVKTDPETYIPVITDFEGYSTYSQALIYWVTELRDSLRSVDYENRETFDSLHDKGLNLLSYMMDQLIVACKRENSTGNFDNAEEKLKEVVKRAGKIKEANLMVGISGYKFGVEKNEGYFDSFVRKVDARIGQEPAAEPYTLLSLTANLARDYCKLQGLEQKRPGTEARSSEPLQP